MPNAEELHSDNDCCTHAQLSYCTLYMAETHRPINCCHVRLHPGWVTYREQGSGIITTISDRRVHRIEAST